MVRMLDLYMVRMLDLIMLHKLAHALVLIHSWDAHCVFT